MQIGLIGLSYSGKTTLFQTLTQIHIDASSTSKRDTNQAIVKVPDARLDLLTNIFKPKKKVNATIEIVDIVGVQKGDNTSSQFNSQFISKVKTNDALIHIVRGFENEAVPHTEGSINIVRDINIIDDELLLTDLAFVEGRIEKLEKDMMKQKNKDDVKKEIEAMQRWYETLEKNIPLRELDFSEDEQKYLKNYQPLTAKPLLIAINMSEESVPESEKIIADIRSKISGSKIKIEPFFAKIELELSQLSEEEKTIFMEEYGLKDSPLDRMIRNAYQLLGLQSFFTVGEDETRAWTIKKGMTAQDAAGVIHTDFYNKFIRAEVVGYDDFIEAGSMVKCKEKGLFRLEGKEYICVDGDILNIRHG
ncbi:Ribosome-binding ATPase YchF [bioreactor metagenome]|uniref:Ribosome-binding ATPase YchF n=1 Tax=bioreactor metagenome TaxID=1076179 RepID=A0A645C4R7_9ZZZZ